jgi:drug/metabolite transporter (DMT)-like permease
MNDQQALPQPPPPPARPDEDPADLARPLFDQLLRSPGALLARLDGTGAGSALAGLAGIAFAGHLAYGLVVGSFSGGEQWWAAPLKVSLGSFLCAAICFPSLFILVSQSGAQTRARHVLGMLLGVLASTGLLLAGFAPVAWIFSQSSTTVSLLAPLHYLVWFVSLLASLRFLKAGLKRWQARRGALTGLWVAVFVLTCLQMTATLRPILGSAEKVFDPQRKFFLLHWGQTVAKDLGLDEGR